VISIADWDGEGMLLAGVEISAAGEVHFHGPGCATWRGETTTIEPERVRELIEALDRSRPSNPHMFCFDCPYTNVSVLGPHGWVHTGTGLTASLGAVLRGFYDQVGANPCQWVPPHRPTP